ncbi:MAG: primosomal protein N' [Deltaproteobacteria bacterium]|nr:primosomal protein N' [Deltaproteobacteria bacterium]
MKGVFADVAVPVPLDKTFTYSVPPELSPDVAIGKRVLVPFGRRRLAGYIMALHHEPSGELKKILPIADIIDPAPLFDAAIAGFYRWLASYYFAPIGSAVDLICPAPAAVKSRRRVRITQSGADALGGISGLGAQILEAAATGITVSALVKRFKAKAVYATLERLKREGLIMEDEAARSGAVAAFEEYLMVTPEGMDAIERLAARAPVQARILESLNASGEITATRLRQAIGEVSAPLKSLVKKGLVTSRKNRVMRDPLAGLAPRHALHEPNSEQKAAIEAITASFNKGGYAPFLLYGVTGSGKTLVYLNALEEVVRAGKKAIFLTAEIALTPWPAAYLAARFPGRVAVVHSGLSSGERLDEWERILSGKVDIVVGARSALFTPLANLGMIIVDEEHETSYKQDDGVRYNARDASLMLAKTLGITIVLGSATPSVETFYNARAGMLTQLNLRKRVEERPLPAVEILDMKTEAREMISNRLKSLLAETFANGAQALLLLNRRGFSNFIICRDCGNSFKCRNCSVTMTMHKAAGRLKCHYCDLSMPMPAVCPLCKSSRLVQPGLGTERLEEEVRALCPDALVGRMDRDTTRRKGSAKAIIDAVEAGRIDCLVGTQMVSKGHHFPGITLVGVLSGDTSLNMPDFRAAERTFQLIT